MGDNIAEYLRLSGIDREDPAWGEQYNLCHASLSPLGIRRGLDSRVAEVIHGLGEHADVR